MLIVYAHFKMVYLGAVYAVSIRVRQFEHRFSLHTKKDKLSKHNFLFMMLYEMIARHIKHNLDTGHLIFPTSRHMLSFEREQSTSVSLFGCAMFVNIYSDVKDKVRKMCINKSKFFTALLADGVDYPTIFKFAKNYTELQGMLEPAFKSLIEKSDNKFTPLMMIYGNYLYHLEQNMVKARKILKGFRREKVLL